MSTSARLLSYRDVCDRVGLSRPSIARMVRDGKFPIPVDLTGNRVGFVEAEVQDWIDARIAARATPAARKARADRSRQMRQLVGQRWVA